MRLDFHSHILPGLDDGATDLENSVELVAAMQSWGVERVTCTPHITNKFRNTPETIRPAFELLQEELYKRNVDNAKFGEYYQEYNYKRMKEKLQLFIDEYTKGGE